MTDADTAEELKRKLAYAEAALQRCEKLAVASHYAGAIMHEVNNPLSAITNLVYLAKTEPNIPRKVEEYMALVDDQLKGSRCSPQSPGRFWSSIGNKCSRKTLTSST